MTRIVWRRSIRVLTLTGGRLEGTWHDTYIEDRRPRELELGGRACERYDNRSSYGGCGVERICTSRHEGRSPVRDQKRQDRSHRTAQRLGSHQIAAVAAIYALPDGFPPLSNSLPCSRSPSHLLQVARNAWAARIADHSLAATTLRNCTRGRPERCHAVPSASLRPCPADCVFSPLRFQ